MAKHVPFLGASLVYLLREGEQETAPAGESPTKEGCTLSHPGGEPCLCISNEFFQVTLEEKGTFRVLDRLTGETYGNLGFLEDEGDGGDTYNFSPVKGDSPLHHPLASLSRAMTHAGPLFQELCILGEVMLPGGLAQDRTSRSAVSMNCPLEMRLQLYQGVPRLHITLEVDNRAQDHRMRMAFPLGTKARAAVTDEAFDLVEIPGAPAGEDWIEKPCGTWPMESFAALMDGERGLAVLARGTRELEIQ
jgi:alpha-mannosidase